MSNIVDKLIKAQKHAMSISPPIGGFPVLAEVLRRAGVKILIGGYYHLVSQPI
jgi:hypothetical protein